MMISFWSWIRKLCFIRDAAEVQRGVGTIRLLTGKCSLRHAYASSAGTATLLPGCGSIQHVEKVSQVIPVIADIENRSHGDGRQGNGDCPEQ
jgi:hypothetical protein